MYFCMTKFLRSTNVSKGYQVFLIMRSMPLISKTVFCHATKFCRAENGFTYQCKISMRVFPLSCTWGD